MWGYFPSIRHILFINKEQKIVLDMECTPYAKVICEVMKLNYSAGEIAAKLSISKDGLRYYEKEGLLPPIARNESGHRIYSESDMEWIFLIRCMRDADMPIFKIKQYVVLLLQGGEDSIPKRRDILIEHEEIIKEKIKNFQNMLSLIGKKLEFYDYALSAESPDEIRCMDYATEWEHFKTLIGGIKHD